MQGLIGKKIGMTRVFNEQGEQIPVTVLECGPCVVAQCKNVKSDGYSAVQLGFDDVPEKRLSRPAAGMFRKNNLPFKRHLREFKIADGDDHKIGDQVTVGIFDKISHVDVTAISKGKGFQGVVRRYKMAGGFMTHGSHSKRRVGSIGACLHPSRVYKGRRMPGHMGVERITQQNLRVIQVRPEENLLLVQGSVPGHTGALVIIKRALKKGEKK